MGSDGFCCDMMERNVSREISDVPSQRLILYSARFDEYMLLNSPDSISGICIEYCPWCGQKLPASKRERWFDELDELGIEYSLFDTEQVPEAYLNDEWWKLESRK